MHFDGGNRLSVGRQYIYNVVNEYYQYLDDVKNLSAEEDERKKERLFYQERKIAGKISFIQLIEGNEGWKRIQARFGKNAYLCENNRLSLDNVKNRVI